MSVNDQLSDLQLIASGVPESPESYMQRLQFATDKNGQRLMSSDPVYRKYVEEERVRLFPGNETEVTPNVVKQDEWWRSDS